MYFPQEVLLVLMLSIFTSSNDIDLNTNSNFLLLLLLVLSSFGNCHNNEWHENGCGCNR